MTMILPYYMQTLNLPSVAGSIYSNYVAPDGNGVYFTIDTPIYPLSEQGFNVTSNGRGLEVIDAKGFGTGWEVRFGSQWVVEGEIVVLSYGGRQLNSLAGLTVPVQNQTSNVKQRALDLWQLGRGMSIHFNTATYTIAGGNPDQLAPATTDPDLFNPTGLTSPDSLDNWVEVMNLIGARSCYLTTKHVDGFCLWPSVISSNRCITGASTWWNANGFDIQLAYLEKCRENSILPCLYFSIWDKKFELDNPEWTDEQYTDFIQAQISEFLNPNVYGTIPAILLDAWEIAGLPYPSYTNVDYASTVALIRSLQPDIVILINDYSRNNLKTEITIYEAGTGAPIPLETNRNVATAWMTVTATNRGWFYDSSLTGQYPSAATQGAQALVAQQRKAFPIFNISQDVTGIYDQFLMNYAAQIGAALP